jgi:hypothetical protein
VGLSSLDTRQARAPHLTVLIQTVKHRAVSFAWSPHVKPPQLGQVLILVARCNIFQELDVLCKRTPSQLTQPTELLSGVRQVHRNAKQVFYGDIHPPSA